MSALKTRALPLAVAAAVIGGLVAGLTGLAGATDPWTTSATCTETTGPDFEREIDRIQAAQDAENRKKGVLTVREAKEVRSVPCPEPSTSQRGYAPVRPGAGTPSAGASSPGAPPPGRLPSQVAPPAGPSPSQVAPSTPTPSHAATTAAPPCGPETARSAVELVPDPSDPKRKVTQRLCLLLAAAKEVPGARPTNGMRCWRAADPALKYNYHFNGLACDLHFAQPGTAAGPDGRARGDRLVAWLIGNHDRFDLDHVIWQGRVYSRKTGWSATGGARTGCPAAGAAGCHLDRVQVTVKGT